MQRTDPLRGLLILIAGLLAVPLPLSAADPLSASEARGKHIYTKGESPASRIITAALSTSEAPASASILPCIQCHGLDGRGIGIISPDINWDVLVDPDGHEHLQRAHGAYDEASLARAIREGLDPADNKFEPTMPKYTMADRDMNDLIAYLKVIDAELDPGLSASTVRIGTVLPTAGPLGAAGTAMRDVIEAYFEFVNVTGGVHGRDLELVVGEYGGQDTPSFWQAQDLVRKEPLFAMISSYMPGYEGEFSALVNERQIPHIGPNTFTGTGSAVRYEFFLQAGLVEQAQVLVRGVFDQALRAQAEPPKLGVVYPRLKGFGAAGDAVQEEGLSQTGERISSVQYEQGRFDEEKVVDTLIRAKVNAVIFLGSAGDFASLGAMAAERNWRPTILAPALLVEHVVFDFPSNFGGEVFLAYASLPIDRTREGVELFEALHKDRGLDYSHSISQVAAFSAARVLVEALENVGPSPSRERLISALESLRDFQPGLTAAVSFEPERRMGPGGAWVVRVDLVNGQLDNERRWVELD